GPDQDAIRRAQKIESMAGGGHVNQHPARTAAHQVEYAQHGEDFIQSRRNAFEKLRKELALEPEIDVHARCFARSGLVDHLLYAASPTSEYSDSIHLRRAKFRIPQNGTGLI